MGASECARSSSPVVVGVKRAQVGQGTNLEDVRKVWREFAPPFFLSHFSGSRAESALNSWPGEMSLKSFKKPATVATGAA